MKILVVTAATLAALTLSTATAAADASGNGSGYCTQPGCIQLRTPGAPGSNAQNGTGAASGAFGAFGKNNNQAGGTDGYQTGLNNSGVAGNRQGNLP